MAKMVNAICVGGAMVRGRRVSGYGLIKLDGAPDIYVDEPRAYFDGMVTIAKQAGHDTAEFEAKLDNWVKTGG